MLKRLTILAMFGALLFWRPCVAENQQGKAHAEQARAAQGQQPAPPVHVIVDPSAAIEDAYAKAHNGEQAPPEKSLPRFERPEWVIVYITAIYVVVNALMLLAIKRQGGYMERQTNLQEAAFLQWINIGNWKVIDDTTDEKKRLCVRAEITNPSAYPLIITGGEIKLMGHNFPGWYVKDSFFPPHASQFAILYVYITDFEYQRLFKSGGWLTFTVKGGFTYIDVLKRQKKQTVEGKLGCNESGADFTPSVPMEPQDGGEAKPN